MERTVEASERQSGGILILEGRMIGPPFVKKAKRLLQTL